MQEKNNLAVPFAIVIAGVLIAIAVFYSSKSQPAVNSNKQDQETEIPSVEIKLNPITQSDHVRGNPSADVIIVEYSDTSCPFCKRFHVTMNQLFNAYGPKGTVAWVYRHFPIKDSHPNAPKEAEATECAAKLGGNNAFWEFADKLYSISKSDQGIPLDQAELPKIATSLGLNESAFNSCVASGEYTDRVTFDLQSALVAGGQGTPFNVIVPTKNFDKEKIKQFFLDSTTKYNLPPGLFLISDDGKRLGVSGSMPYEFMDSLVKLLTQG